MANAMYPTAKKAILDGDIDFLVDDIKWLLIDTASYTYSDTDEFRDDIAAGVVATSAALAGKSTTGGVFDASDLSPTFTAVTGATAEALILFKDTGTAGTSRLILYLDTVASGLPVTPNGGDINVVHDNGANKIFAING